MHVCTYRQNNRRREKIFYDKKIFFKVKAEKARFDNSNLLSHLVVERKISQYAGYQWNPQRSSGRLCKRLITLCEINSDANGELSS